MFEIILGIVGIFIWPAAAIIVALILRKEYRKQNPLEK